MVDKLGLLHEGKAKKVFATTNPDLVWMEFKDDATAFNGLKKGTITDKGLLNAAITIHLYHILEKEGIPTHFVRKMSSRELLVRAVKIIPIEFVVRNVAAGSLAKRMGVEEGLDLKLPVLEFYYKDDALNDPMINEYHIKAFDLARAEHIERAKDYAFKVNDILSQCFQEAGLILVDFKLEFGLDSKGEVLLADEISPDSCRLWDAATKEKLDKDRFRRDLGAVEDAYREVWKRLREGKKCL